MSFRQGPAGGHITEELAAQVARIYERAQSETLALIQSQPAVKIDAPVRE
jgi:hypothetical protein